MRRYGVELTKDGYVVGRIGRYVLKASARAEQRRLARAFAAQDPAVVVRLVRL